jgi:4-hydroxy-tetrahydrodipicolinate synthase
VAEAKRIRGVICPLLTPFGPGGRIARDLWVAHAHRVIGQGAHFLSPFGTTGEALSCSVAERIEALEWLVEAGIPPERLMPGTGVPALPETVELTGHAVGLGCPAVMVLPSFFYRAAGEEGQARWYGELIERVAAPGLRVILYHIPQNTGVPVSPELAARLAASFPGTVVAYKDSGGDLAHTEAVIRAAPDLAVFPASESLMARGLAAGAAGCISATVNLNAAAIRGLYERVRAGEAAAAETAAVSAFRTVLERAGLIPGQKALLAALTGDARWLALRPPLADASPEAGRTLLGELGPLADALRHAV